jgi:hypothetical protein
VAGTKEFAFAVEVGSASDKRTRTLQVVDDKFEVLILEDTWRWEYKFLHRLFEDDPSFRFTALLARGKQGFAQFGSPDRRVNLVGFPQSRAELEGFDCFLIGDVDPTRWPRGLAESIAGLVSEGKALIAIAGPNLGKWSDVPELAALLPVDIAAESGTPVAGPVDVRFRAEGASSPFAFRIADETLPPFDRIYPVVRKRAGATVLLEAVKQRNSYGPLIAMAEQTVGRGRVLFVATDTLWKWHTFAEKEGPTPYARFWQQAMRAVAPVRSAAGSVQVWLTPSRSQGTVGRRMSIEAEVQSDRPVSGSKLDVAVVAPGGTRRPLAVLAESGRPWIHRGDWLPQEPGQHTLQATLSADGKTLAETSVLLPIEPRSDESHDIGIDETSLRRLSDATGGRWIDPARPDTWPEQMSESPEVCERVAFDPWNSYLLILLLCGVLGVDWLLRVFLGLT